MKHGKYFGSDNVANDTNKELKWCSENGLDLKNLNEMRLWIDEVKKRLLGFRIKNLPSQQTIWNPREKIFALKIAFAGAFGIGNFFSKAVNLTCNREVFNLVEENDPRKTVYFRNMNTNIIGAVYEEQIISALDSEEICGKNTKMAVTFDEKGSQRVLITFNNDSYDDNEDKVAPEVYNAVKLRLIKGGIYFRVMDPISTQQFALDHKMGIIKDSKFQINRTFLAHPELCPLPTCFEVELKGYITHVISWYVVLIVN